MILTKAQATIASNTHRFRVINCGRRFGKTTLAVEEIKGKALSKDTRIVYIAPTYQQARDIAWELLKKELKPIITNINESRLEVEVLNQHKGTSKIYLRGWESIETLRGRAFDFMVIDEIAMMRNFWVNWQEVLRPTLTDTRGEVMFISTPRGFNHFYDLYNLERTDNKFKSFHFTSYDNPHLPVDEIEEAKKQLTEDRFAQEYMADFRKTEGLVYKEFDRTRHLFENTDKNFVERILGIDFGYTNPTAILDIRKDSDNNYWVMGEWYKTGKTISEIIEIAKSYSPNAVYPDPEAPEKILELQKAGLNIREVVKGKDSISTGIQKIRDLFKQDRIRIHKSCINLIWELETYKYPEKKPDSNEKENPIKENDHALDALRYALSMNMPVSSEPALILPINDFY